MRIESKATVADLGFLKRRGANRKAGGAKLLFWATLDKKTAWKEKNGPWQPSDMEMDWDRIKVERRTS